MRIVVAGATGFVGRALVRALSERGHEVVEIARRHPDPAARWDVAAAPPPPSRLAGAAAVVNLVGKKRGSRRAFEAAHVHAVRNLVAACRLAGVPRLVHVSVAGLSGLGSFPYAETKRRGEQAVRASGLDHVLVRPDVVFGPGDDFVRNAVRALSLAAWVPVPAGAGRLAPVHVEDLAATLCRAAEGAYAPGTTITVRGPQPLSAGAAMVRVGRAVDLPARPVRIPSALLRGAAAVAGLFPDPLVTPSQVRILAAGLYDPGAAEPVEEGDTPFDPRRIRTASGAAGLGLAHPRARLLALTAAGRLRILPWLLAGVAAGFFLLSRLGLSPWSVVGIVTPLAALAAHRLFPGTTAALLRWPDRPRAAARDALLVFAVTAASALWLLGPAAPPPLARFFAPLHSLLSAAPPAAAAMALPLVVGTEDLVFRGAFNLGLAGRFGPGAAVVLAAALFALAHAAFGAPASLLAAAFACGLPWNLLVLRHGSIQPAFFAHLALDLLVLAAYG